MPINSATTTAKASNNGQESVVGNGLFGIGLGYSLKTTDHHVQAESKITAKADSVGLYVKQIGHKILPFLLGPTQAQKYSLHGNSLAAASRPKTTSVP